MSLGNDDNRDDTDDDPDLRMPYRKRKRFHETTQPQEKWREACYRLHPNLDSLPESQKEAIESRIKVEYYIALGLDSSLPRTATSGSIETPRVSPLLQRPPRVPSQASTTPATPARPIEPMGPLPPLTLLPNLHLQSQISPLLPVPPLTPLSPLSPHLRLSQLPLGPLPPIVQTNPYLSSFYPAYRKPLITSGPIKPLQNTFVKSEEKPFLKSYRIPCLKEKKPLNKSTRYVKPLEDCFIKPIHPVAKLYKDPFLDPPKEIHSQDTSTRDLLFKSTTTSYLYLEAGEPRFKKPKRRELFLESTVDQLKKDSITRLDKELSKANVTTVRKTSDDRFITPYPFLEPIEESSQQRPIYTQTEDPFIKPPDPLGSVYSPSTSAFSIPKFAQSSSIYVDCPSVYPTVECIELREEIADNNNDDSVNKNINEENDEPIDYSIKHSSDFQPQF